jgi:hypothetical protein
MVARTTATVCGAAVLLGLFGCGMGGPKEKDAPGDKDASEKVAPEETARGKELKKLGEAYHAYHEEHGRGPADVKAFRQWAQVRDPEAVPVVEQTGPGGAYDLVYGAYNFDKDFPKGTSGTLLAYENKPSPGGRIVLLADGSVKVMDEKAFAAAVRPGATDAAKAPGGKLLAESPYLYLTSLALVYRSYWEKHQNEGPPSQEELVRFAATLYPEQSQDLSVIRDGPRHFTTYFGCHRENSFPAGRDKTVLAYESQPAPGRRQVLTADGKVWQMTEEAFAAAPRPKPTKK